MVLEREMDESRKSDLVATVLLDIYSKWISGILAATNSADNTRKAMRIFLGPQLHPDHIYSDNGQEITKAIRDLEYEHLHDTSTPNRPATNGQIERVVRTIKEGITSLMLQSGFTHQWWPNAMRCFCFLHNTLEKLADGETPYERRFKMTLKDCFRGFIFYPFG